ncbi:MAG: hypothetical protein MH252_02905 [Thermosynechococcaceae cyanobacterium MS004]|nr:hypothetical protein [Thermosynechococcaceae cyanobacterium MS004]
MHRGDLRQLLISLLDRHSDRMEMGILPILSKQIEQRHRGSLHRNESFLSRLGRLPCHSPRQPKEPSLTLGYGERAGRGLCGGEA